MQHEASGNGEKWRIQYEGQDGIGGEIAKIKRILAKRVTPGGPRRRNPTAHGRASCRTPTYYIGRLDVAQPVEIFKNIKGMTRDFAVDALPAGYLWDLVDAIPNRKGARIEQRGAWEYFSSTALRGHDLGRLPRRLQQGRRSCSSSRTR